MKKILIVNSNYYSDISNSLVKSVKYYFKKKKNNHKFNKCTWSF